MKKKVSELLPLSKRPPVRPIKMDLNTRASRISEDAEVVKVAKRAASGVGLKPNVRVICGATDASSYNEKGIETVVIGTGGRAEHTKEENIAVADMEKAVRIIQHIFKELSERG